MKHPALFLLVITILAISVIWVLFQFSIWNDRRQHRPDFDRIVLSDALQFTFTTDIHFNSYYIAGATNTHAYLGNSTSPFHMLEIALEDETTTPISLNFDHPDELVFRAPQLVIDSPFFFINDGTVPVTYRGRIGKWDYAVSLGQAAYFSTALPIGSQSFGIRTVSSETNENVLGKMDYAQRQTQLSDTILEKQVDGRFCTDGILMYDKSTRQMVYLYYYRNEYIGLDTNLHMQYRGNTIDSISRAQLSVARIESENSYSLSAPPLLVNRHAQAADGRLFVLSGLRARNETPGQFNNVSVFDVYDLASRNYISSFYIPDFAGSKVRQFHVSGGRLLALYDHHLTSYHLLPAAFD